MGLKKISSFPLNEKFSGFSGLIGLSGLVPNYGTKDVGSALSDSQVVGVY